MRVPLFLGRFTSELKHNQTLTLDKGREFAGHRKVTEKTNIAIYFVDPYASYQRGTNENTTGLLRRCWLKKTDFSTITEAELQQKCILFNATSRVAIEGLTPFEAYTGERASPIP